MGFNFPSPSNIVTSHFRYFSTFFVWAKESRIPEVMKIFDDSVLHCDQFVDYGIYHPNK